MAERAPLGSHKVWFGDDRSATFRLPLTDAPRLIAALAEALVPASELRRVE